MHGLCHMEFLTGLSCRCLILVRLSIAMIKHHDQKCLGEERLFSSYCLQFIIQENQGRNLETGPEAESMEEHWLLTCSPRLLQPVFLYHLGPPAWAWLLLQWIPHTHACRPLSESCFLKWDSLFPNGSGLCETDIKPASTYLDVLLNHIMKNWWTYRLKRAHICTGSAFQVLGL